MMTNNSYSILVNPGEEWSSRWEEFNLKSSFGSPFQSYAFLKALEKTDDLQTITVAAVSEGEIVGLVTALVYRNTGIKGYMSRRAIVFGGPVLDENHPEAAELLIENLSSELEPKVIYLEIRLSFDYRDHLEKIAKIGFAREPRYNVVIDLAGKDSEQLLSNMKSNRRREIRYSAKEGVVHREITDSGDVRLLYAMLLEFYNKELKLPLPSYSYFKMLSELPGGKVFGVFHGDKLIAGAFCLLQPGKTIYTQYYIGYRNYHKKIFPTHMAVMAVIDFAVRNQMKKVDLMGAGKPGEKYGVRDYKLRFGGELIDTNRYIRVFKPGLYGIGTSVIKATQNLNKFINGLR